ncbi:hypothetical protein LTR37_004836 [Vermiconidia calcicola]|uniref:Uncharacterized protein n=1 Tax=Vermiconidia calcicola TaxID=1690605 RepID=A0ACC3NLL8_9PEZI|nr:hypothetical protein LTR37_004836 [Vermiconidia calcicola]
MAPPKKRPRLDQPTELIFDTAARQEYLTGFHKRKLQRIENARDAAMKREKEERVKERRQLRDQRKEDLEKQVAEFNAELRKLNPDISDAEPGADGEQGWVGIEEVAIPAPEVAQDEEYVDEDKYTTVTVDAMDGEDEDEEEAEHARAKEEEAKKARAEAAAKASKKRIWNKDGQTKAKKKKFRYESKAERSATRQKQKSKNHAAKVRRTGDK